MVFKILVEKMFKTTLEDVLSIRSVDVSKTFPISGPEDMSWELEVQPRRRHESLGCWRLEDVLCKWSWRPFLRTLSTLLKTSWELMLLTYWRRPLWWPWNPEKYSGTRLEDPWGVNARDGLKTSSFNGLEDLPLGHLQYSILPTRFLGFKNLESTANL